MKLNRADRSLISEWWFTVDRVMLLALLLLLVFGLLVSLAASPPMAIKHGLDPFYYAKRHTLFFIPALLLLFTVSLLNSAQLRRLSLVILVLGLGLMALVLWMGPEVNGARRWVKIAGFSLQPSEFVKPAFVVLAAWLFGESRRRADMPCNELSLMLFLLVASLLILQPDFGQTLLITLVWGALFFLAGMPLRWLVTLMVAAAAGVVMAYLLLPHVADRIDRFIDPSKGDTLQTDRAIESFREGGWFGVGPGEGQLKHLIPDSHSDFIFAVVAEEFGIVACLALLSLFAFVVLRGLARAMKQRDAFVRYAASGLVMLFGMQAAINMAVNIGLLPAKGMTLPFISYGGSSLIASAIGMGMVLSLTRTHHADLSEKPLYTAS